MPTGEHSLPLGLKYPPGALGSTFTQHQGSAAPSLPPYLPPPPPHPEDCSENDVIFNNYIKTFI